MMQVPVTHTRCGSPLQETPQVTILQRPQDQLPVIRHEGIAQHAHKNFGLSFCQGFFERGIVSVIGENPIMGISTVEYVKDHSPRRLACCSWYANEKISRKRPLSKIIWTYPLFFDTEIVVPRRSKRSAEHRPACACGYGSNGEGLYHRV